MPVCQVFPPCFQGKTTEEHIFIYHRSACEVWLDSDILEISLEMAVTWLLPGAIHLLNPGLSDLGKNVDNLAQDNREIRHATRESTTKTPKGTYVYEILCFVLF